MRIIDNFLSDYQFRQIQSIILGDHFSWYYNKHTVKPGDGNSMFTHTFYCVRPPWNGQCSAHYSIWNNCLHKLGCEELFRIKANLSKKTIFHRKCLYHIDQFDCPNTALFYVNTNNGWTHVKGCGKVKSVANRMVIFDSNLYHRGVTCTDEDVRVAVNFNYK